MNEYQLRICQLIGCQPGPLGQPSFYDTERQEQQAANIVRERCNISIEYWAKLTEAERLYWLEEAIELCLSDSSSESGKATPRGPGRPSDDEERAKIYDEYYRGLEEGTWETPSTYLEKKHGTRYRKNKRNARSWLSQLLKKERIQRGEVK